MEFWGAEVKSGESHVVEPGDDSILHLSQACLGEIKKDKANEPVYLYVNTKDKKLVLGMLSADKFPQISFDLVFDKKFELSHNWKNGSVYFTGYASQLPAESESEDLSDSDLGEDFPVDAPDNGKPAAQIKQENLTAGKSNAIKSESAPSKQKVKIVEPKKDITSSDDSEESDEEDDESDDEDMKNSMGPSDDEDEESEDDEDESDEEDEETPKKAVPSKKRPAEAAAKTPASDKKAKMATPQKTDGKKVSGHAATPHPAKHAGKTPANNDKSKPQTPKSAGSHQCKPCNRSFNSEQALQSHTKAKHSGEK